MAGTGWGRLRRGRGRKTDAPEPGKAATRGDGRGRGLATDREGHRTRRRRWKKALWGGAAGMWERGVRAAATAESAEETVRDLHAKIGELAVASDFVSRKLKPWTGK